MERKCSKINITYKLTKLSSGCQLNEVKDG